ncbi:MAG TPA: c-type cytochrome domain-containing protein, partial [Verrucomicrobiae bacterium]|nr:c-type cytochrome domain-containing protein [Verrucomicrobiae bacterium]
MDPVRQHGIGGTGGRGLARCRRLWPAGFPSLALWLATLVCRGAPGSEGIQFFEEKIRPLLAEHCYQCHSAQSEKLKGGLHLDTREGALKGGNTRAAVVPGEPDKSLMIEAVRYENPDLQMPPKKRLSDAQIADLVSWVTSGAPWPEESAQGKGPTAPTFNLEHRRQEHWCWQPLQAGRPPSVQDTNWPASPIDRFILAKLEQNHLKPALRADKRTLIRRVYFDLIGLPPAPGDVEAFLQDASPAAF